MKILTTENILEHWDKTILCAKERLTIISPYIQLSERTENLLSHSHVNVFIVCGKNRLEKSEYMKLRNLPNAEVRFVPNLHAKCVLNEKFAVVSSMNLYSASENNYELGCLISQAFDFTPYKELERYVYDIIRASVPYAHSCNERF